jgi:hypothetical protein
MNVEQTRNFNEIWSQNEELIYQMTAMKMQHMTDEELFSNALAV